MSSGICRVSDCTQHGLFFKRLDRHLKRVHPEISREENYRLPTPNSQQRNIKQKSSKDRHIRRPCLVPGCWYYNVIMSRLSDHLWRRHGLTLVTHDWLYHSREDCTKMHDHIEQKSTGKTLPGDLTSTLPGACCYSG